MCGWNVCFHALSDRAPAVVAILLQLERCSSMVDERFVFLSYRTPAVLAILLQLEWCSLMINEGLMLGRIAAGANVYML